MIADLHAHYPMHVLNVEPRSAFAQMKKIAGRPGWGEKGRALIVWLVSLFFNDKDLSSGYRIPSPESMRAGGVGLAMSVLYEPFEEVGRKRHYKAPPEPS